MTTHTIACNYSTLVPEWNTLTPFTATHISTTTLPNGQHSLTYQSKAGKLTLTLPQNINPTQFLKYTKQQLIVNSNQMGQNKDHI